MTQPPPPYPGQIAAKDSNAGRRRTVGTDAPPAGRPVGTDAPPAGRPTPNGPPPSGPPPNGPVQGGRPQVGPAQGGPTTGPPGPPNGALGGPPAGAPPIAGAAAKQTKAPRVRGPRRARLQLRHINPWTVLKFSCVLAIALFFVWMIVVGVLYGVLDASGAIKKVNDTVVTINGSTSKAPITRGLVFGGAAIVGVVNIVLFIALSTIGSVVYNLCADLVGGVELTLSEG